METIVGEYVNEIILPDDQPNVTQTFTSMTDDITYTAFKVCVLTIITSSMHHVIATGTANQTTSNGTGIFSYSVLRS